MSNKKFNARHGVSVGTTPVDVIDDTGAVLTNAATATKLLNSRTISISGDVVATGSFDGSGNLDLAATIQANSVALGTDTTGNYMVDVSAGTGVSVSHTQSEGSTATISIGQAVGTSDNVTFNNLTLAGELRGPATFVIDPAAVGDNTGKVVIKGDLQIDGTTTTINSTTTTIDDLVLTLGGDTAPASDDTFDKGIEYRWFDTQARVGFFGFDRSTGKLTFIPQSSLSSGVYSGTTGEIDAKIDWSNVLNKPTIDNTTYNHLAVTATGGALIRLNSSGGANDDIKLASGSNVTVAYTNDDTITISSTDTNTTYSVKASSQTGGAGIDLDAGGSGSGTDTVKILGSSGTTVTRTDADTITISSTSVGDGTLSVTTKSAGLTNTDVTLELSGAYSANTSTNRTIKAVVGPALTNLATLMATAGAGFIRRSATADEFSIDTNTYLTAEADTLATVTGRGATTTAQITVDSVLTTNNNNGTNFRVGDDAWIGDINTANTIRVTGLQDATKAYIVFGNSDATALGRSGTGALTYGGNTIYHSGNLPTYLTTESDTLSSVTGRGATTATDITLGNGVATSTTNFGGTTVNYLITSSTGSLILKTKDQTTTYSRNVNIQTGNSTQAGGNSGGILIKTGNATGGSGAFAGDISMYPGSSDGIAAIVSISAGESVSGTTSIGGYVTIKGGSSTTTTGTTTANGGNVYIYGGDVTSGNNFTKNTGSIYMEGGGATGSGTITYGTINIGRTSASSAYGTSAVNIGNSSITTTIDGTVKLPTVGTSGFVKLGAGGQLSADTNTYLVGVLGTSPISASSAVNGIITISHATSGVTAGTYNSVTVDAKGHVTGGTSNSYLTAEADTLATVTARGATTSVVSSFTGGGGDASPALRITQTTGTASFNWVGSFLNSAINGAAGRNAILLVGQAESSKNSGYYGFNWQGNSSNSNFLTFGLFGVDNVFNIFGSGNSAFGTTTAPTAKVSIVSGTPSSVNALELKSNTKYVSPDGTKSITTRMLDTNVLTFSGSTGQLFSISDSMTGTIYSVNDVSGIPSIEVLDSGLVKLNEYGGNTNIGGVVGTSGTRLTLKGYANSWDTTTPGITKGTLHIDIYGSAGGSDGGAITFSAKDSTNPAQAGIYVTSSGSFGTRMYIATTDSYATGSRTAISISEGGVVNFPRARPTYAGTNLALTTEIPSVPTVSNGSLGVSVSGTAATSGTALAWGTATGFSANTSSNYTYDLRVGPALSALATLMSTAGAGFIKRGATADTYSIDTNSYALSSHTHSYLSSESDTLATVTSRGNVTTGSITLPSGSTNGYWFWGGTATYGIRMGDDAEFHYGPVTGYSIKTSIDSVSSTRGFTWGVQGSTPVAALNVGNGNMQIAGSFSAASKSFLIPHPTKEGWKLRYGSLEGPENGVYIRGKLKGKNKIELPEYWTKLIDPDSITVSLTPIGKHQKLYVEDIADNVVTIANDGLFAREINCFFVVYGERVDIDKLVVEYE